MRHITFSFQPAPHQIHALMPLTTISHVVHVITQVSKTLDNKSPQNIQTKFTWNYSVHLKQIELFKEALSHATQN